MAKGKDMMATIGPWAYIIGLVIAVLAGLFAQGNPMVFWGLGALGLLVGLLNVTEKETLLFLVAAIAFLSSANSLAQIFASVPALGYASGSLFQYLVAFTAPAAAIVALKALYEVSKSG